MVISIGSIVAKAIISYAVKSGLDKWLKSNKGYEKELAKVIDETIEGYAKLFPIDDFEGKFAFYKSQILIDELLKFRFFNEAGYVINYNKISDSLKENKNIAKPSKKEISNFLQIFDEKVNSNKSLKNLEINENYKSEIFNISEKIDIAYNHLSDKADAISNQLDDLLSNLNFHQKELLQVSSRFTRPKILIKLFKTNKFSLNHLSDYIFDSRDSLEIASSLRLIRGISYKAGNELLKDNRIISYIEQKLLESLENKDILSGLSVISACTGLSLELGLRLITIFFSKKIHLKDSILFEVIRTSLYSIIEVLKNNTTSLKFELPANIYVDSDINFIEYKSCIDSVNHKVYNPSLMWDCNCDTIENLYNELVNPNCKIHSSVNGILVNQFTGLPYRISFKNIEILSYSGSIWPPSIDTLYFLQTIDKLKSVITEHNIENVIDIGTGTGIIGIYLKKNISTLNKVAFIDINPDAIALARYNWNLNFDLENDDFFVNDSLKNMDINYNIENTLIVCMPPYLAYPNTKELKTIKNITYQGISSSKLLNEIMYNYVLKSRFLIFGTSTLAGKTKSLDQAFSKIYEHDIPMRIPSVLLRPSHIKWLLLNKCIFLKKGNNHIYYHKFKIYSNLIS